VTATVEHLDMVHKHKTGPIPCPISSDCDSKCISHNGLREHVAYVHRGRSYQCPWPGCKQPFGSTAALQLHIKKHENPGQRYPCPRKEDLGCVYIVIDALDESPKDTHRETALGIITELRALPEPELHLVVSSRDEPDIRESLEAKPEEVIGMKNESVDRDIESFISQHLKENRRLRKWEAYHKQIEEALTKGAQGV
jgi:hypothetical protein